MSQQQTPVASLQQLKAPAAPAVPSTPVPLSLDLLRLVSGGSGTTSYPGNNW